MAVSRHAWSRELLGGVLGDGPRSGPKRQPKRVAPGLAPGQTLTFSGSGCALEVYGTARGASWALSLNGMVTRVGDKATAKAAEREGREVASAIGCSIPKGV